ncbi:hypothetical protein WOLCODRAFT_162280 [Wolfiporia cocos MD-104 SS10]|uniref:Cytochrome P450 n=1 Tax=Wolfiporia cocos (strain MD-104) TaxID=742152 RepID=A0A2H3JDQ4_WOLCO|nr:hypothetical protein WOLCODRAFT_162280 [Wolfiporia cocos MD-104 SS10]
MSSPLLLDVVAKAHEMLTVGTVVVLVFTLVVTYVTSTFLQLLIRQARSPLRHLNGPQSQSFFMGNLQEMHDQENNNLIARWEQQYGNTFVYRGFIGGCRLMTTDPVAIAHIMGRAYEYPKPDFLRESLSSMAAGNEGLLTVEGEDHRRQLRDIWYDISSSPHPHLSSDDHRFRHSPSDPFAGKQKDTSSGHTTSILLKPFSAFVSSKVPASRQTDKGLELPRHSSDLDEPPASAPRTPSPDTPALTKVDVLPWLARATLDVIGEAGFGYYFDSLPAAMQGAGHENELARAFGTIFNSARKFRVITILQAWFPILLRFRTNNATMQEAQDTMRRIGLALIEERQAKFVAEKAAADHKRSAIGDEQVVEGRDLLSVLIRSNISSIPSQRLTLNETLCQISTFLSAGHETVSSALTWTLYALARAPHVQNKLREQLRALPTTAFNAATPLPPPLFYAIFRNPYIDAVVREALRLHAPVTATMRVAAQDDIVPVSRPFCDRYGRKRDGIRLRRGDIITIPLQAMNRSTEVWGEDAAEFRPERWEGIGDDEEGQTSGVRQGRGQRGQGPPGLWGNIMTFGNGNPIIGNRACIGFRFAINEMKIFLAVLVRDLEFSIDPSIEVEKKINVVTRPCVKSEPDMGNQMPLYIRPIPP